MPVDIVQIVPYKHTRYIANYKYLYICMPNLVAARS